MVLEEPTNADLLTMDLRKSKSINYLNIASNYDTKAKLLLEVKKLDGYGEVDWKTEKETFIGKKTM